MRGEAKLNRTLESARLDRTRGLVRAKPKNFPYLSYFPRRGVLGEPTKNGKEIFGFASPLQTTKGALFIFYFRLLFSPYPRGETRRFLSAFGGGSKPRGFVHWWW